MYSPETLIATLGAIAALSAATLAALYLILPAIHRRSTRRRPTESEIRP